LKETTCWVERTIQMVNYRLISLALTYAPDGMNVNQFMVRAGAAWVYEQYNTDPVLPVFQNEARQQKRGLWSDADPVPPWIWRHRK
ncbi:thermonuclease family protein, partial [Escherichia coli]|uniref:thermonuclease family protein n=1 Tax=Escherichia coli TaxID=562 RepID=UPI00234DABB0